MLLYYTKNCNDNMELQMSSLLGRDPLWFDSCKRPPPVSDHSVLACWVVAYGRFDCIQCFGSLLRGGASSCASKHSSTSSKENVLKRFFLMSHSIVNKLPKDISKESKNVILYEYESVCVPAKMITLRPCRNECR